MKHKKAPGAPKDQRLQIVTTKHSCHFLTFENKVKPIGGGRKPSRNDDCPCGSGKKFKKCCGKDS